ncbi:ABC transporter permease [candidate division KSB1 bacterium]|nr:ABC transporter permease [candidate division KSB1 bacterium]RQW01143.1 MAG: ABC transporter permease [candidate division KSB1 bacterium]
MSKNKFFNILLDNMPILLFVFIFLTFGLLSNRFLQIDSLLNIVKQASYIGIVAVGMTFVLLTAGIDLSVGSNMYVSAIVAGLAIDNYGISPWLALFVCLFIGFLFGSINAFFITKVKIVPFIVTLATMVAGRGLGLLLTKSRAVNFPDAVIHIGSIQLFGFLPLPILIFAIVVLFAYLFLNNMPLGRQMYAVGHDIQAAQKAGIHTSKVLATSYMICGLLAALGGFISVAQLGIVNSGFGKGDEFDAIAAAVLGGTSLFGGVGSVFPGTVLGAILIQMVWSGLVFTQVNLYLQPLVFAGILFLAVFLDSVRSRLLTKRKKRHIRVEK